MGFSDLNLSATVSILLSGERLLKSSGRRVGSDNSIDTLGLSIARLYCAVLSQHFASSESNVIFSLSSSSITLADNTT